MAKLTTDEVLKKSDRELLDLLRLPNSEGGQDMIKALLDMRREEANREISEGMRKYTWWLVVMTTIQAVGGMVMAWKEFFR